VRLTVPDVRRGPALRARSVSKSKRTVTAYGYRDKLPAQYPATIGGPRDPLPIGDWTITSVVHDPWFNWDPIHFWNANPNEAAQKLPHVRRGTPAILEEYRAGDCCVGRGLHRTGRGAGGSRSGATEPGVKLADLRDMFN
jgi:hypothetical protein